MSAPANKKQRCDKAEEEEEKEEVLPEQNENLIPEEDAETIEADGIILPYDVVKIIFKYPLAKDLCSAAMVCRLWQDVAADELKRRKSIIKMEPFEDAMQESSLSTHFRNYLTCRPMIGILFNSSGVPLPTSVGKHVPHDCLTLSINNKGIIFEENEYEQADGNVVMSYLSDNPQVGIEYIIATNRQLTHFNKKLVSMKDPSVPRQDSKVESLFDDAFKRLKDLKCTILLTSDRFRHESKLLKMNPIKKHVSVLWGGIAKSLTLCKKNKEKSLKNEEILWIAILISGPNVRSWSTVITEDWKDKEGMEEKLLDLRKNVKELKHTVAFMYACFSRGESYHSEKNVETSMFKKVFPHIPLVGCFGLGEFGTITVGENPDTTNKIHEYSIAVMILTYG